MRRYALWLLVLCGCARQPVDRPESILEQAVRDLRAGELARAQTECDRGLAMVRNHGDTPLYWKLRLVRAEALNYNGRAEEVLTNFSQPLASVPQFAALDARRKFLLGQAHYMLGHRAESARWLAEARQDASVANALDVVVETDIIRSAVLIYGDQPAEAAKVLYPALQIARSLHSDYLEAVVLVNLGSIDLSQRRYDQAVTAFEQSSEKARQAAPRMFGYAQNNLAICYINLGDLDRAIKIQKETVARYERTGDKVLLQIALGSAGESYIAKGDYPAAISYLQRAFAIANETGHPQNAVLWATNLAAVYTELKDWSNAEVFNNEAISLKRSIKNSTLAFNTLNSADIAAGKGEFDIAEKLYDNALLQGRGDPYFPWDVYSGKAAVELGRNRIGEAMKDFEASLDALETARSKASLRTDFKLPFLAPRIRLYQAYVNALLSQGQVERALAVADSSRAQVLGERSGSAPARRLPPGAFSKLAGASGSVLLSYWLAPEQSHAWVVTAREIHHVPLPGASVIEPLVAQYQGAIERQLADPLRTRIAAGEKLYDILIAPLRQWLPAGSRVVLVADGVLHGLNFEALPVPGAPTAHYLIQDLTFEIVPSLSAAATGSRPAAARKLLLLGDATSSAPDFPPLAAAPAEIASVLRHFPPSQVVLTRESATPQAFLAAAKGGPFAAVHFTAHAVANRETPLESAVLLSGGKLYARDVMDLPLQADLVTVSACRGAGERAYSGEGLIGFAWAFLRAGARNVIAGLWNVNDQSTAELMDTLYRELAAGKRPADALRTAKLAMIESPGNLRKPYYWAPFQLFTVAP